MEQWRSFFNNAGDDIWTIIKEAILLAAHDYPREFRERRCDIAEILFATAKLRGDVEVVRQSASMINNYRNQMDARRAMDREYANAPETTHVSGKHTEFCSAEANKDSEISRTRMRTIISSIRENLNGSMQMNSDEAILSELQRLQSLDIDVHVLKEMDIGKQVNNLRKHPNKDIRVLAKKLIRCWKEIIDDWFIHEGVRHDLHREHQTSDQDSMENERFSTGVHRYNCISLIELPEEMQQCSHLNARDSYSGLAEERGSSNRTDIAGLNNTESEQPYISMDSIPVESSVEMQNSLARHRSRNGKEGVLSRQCTDCGRMIAHSESRSSKFLEKCESHKQNQLASAANQHESHTEGIQVKEKSDTDSKRKLYESSYSHMDNAKKQLTIHPIKTKEFSQDSVSQLRTLQDQDTHWDRFKSYTDSLIQRNSYNVQDLSCI